MSLVESDGVMANRSVIAEGSIESGLSGAAIGQQWQSGDVAIIWLSRGGCLTCLTVQPWYATRLFNMSLQTAAAHDKK
jgi:hypothetical protein